MGSRRRFIGKDSAPAKLIVWAALLADGELYGGLGGLLIIFGDPACSMAVTAYPKRELDQILEEIEHPGPSGVFEPIRKYLQLVGSVETAMHLNCLRIQCFARLCPS